jgi:hypothetical protein
MEYRCEATSVVGFIQQLAVAYIGRGYFFYVTGEIPERKDPRAVDRRIIEKYGVSIGKTARYRRKTAGLANIQYIRYRQAFVLLATSGKHPFFEEERKLIRDVREVPIKFGGYAVSYRAGHPHVRIEQARYLELKAYLSDLAIHRGRDWLGGVFSRLAFEPYAPIRVQLHCMLREVNRRRALARYELLPASCVRSRRRVVSPFGSVEPLAAQERLEVPRAVDDSQNLNSVEQRQIQDENSFEALNSKNAEILEVGVL